MKSIVKLTLDNQIFRLQPFGGITTYWRELEAGLCQRRIEFSLAGHAPIFRALPLIAGNCVFHSSYYRLCVGPKSRTVTTVHDLIPERGLAQTLAGKMSIAYRRRLFGMTDGFICVSEQTRRELLSIYPRESAGKPIQVAQHGNPRSSFVAGREPLPRPLQPDARDRTFLFVGNRGGYKAFDVAIDAFALSRLWSEGYQLLCTGSAFSPLEHKMLEKRGVDAFVRWTGPLETQDLFKLYAKSLALLYPSSYEGFGLPIVEAMTFGCIPLVAGLDPMQSIVGKVAATAPPGDAYALRDLMLDIATPKRAAEISVRALERADDFQWSRSIDLHIALYRALGAEVFRSADDSFSKGAQ